MRPPALTFSFCPNIQGRRCFSAKIGQGCALGIDEDRRDPHHRSLAACRKGGIYPGIHCGGPAYAPRMIRMGFRLTTIANDSGLMAKAAREAVAGVWQEVGEFR
jgi:4-hydroxy-2-oxoheptanedioate aldolase